MLYVFKDSVTTKKLLNGKYVGGEEDDPTFAYKYVDSLSGAKLFGSVSEAIDWLERTAYKNGKRQSCYNGCLRLMKVETVPIQYKEIGEVK